MITLPNYADSRSAKSDDIGVGLRLTGPGVLELIREVIEVAGTVRARAAGVSMWPTIRDGSLVTLVRVDPLAIRPGQIVLVDRNGFPVLHRVLRIAGHHVHTIGDACIDADPPTMFPDVVALATSVSDHRGEITLTGSWRYGFRSWTLYAVGEVRLALARRWRRVRRAHITRTSSLGSTTHRYENRSSATPGAEPRNGG